MVPKGVIVVAGVALAGGAVVLYLRHCRKKASGGTTNPPPALPAATAGVTAANVLSADDTKPAEEPESKQRCADALAAKERGNKLFQGKEFSRAIEEYSRALELHPDHKHNDVAVFLGNRAQCHTMLEDYARAEQDCDASLVIWPQYVKALCRRGVVREKQGKLQQASVL